MRTIRNHYDLVLAKKQIIAQNIRLEQYCEELIVVNKKLEVRCKEKESRECELVIAYSKLIFENNEKVKRNAELIIADKNLLFENTEKNKRAFELAFANSELTKAKKTQKEYLMALEEIMFMISHKIRNSIANILGVSQLLQFEENRTTDDLNKYIQNIIQSAKHLNVNTHELSTFIHTNRYKICY